MTDSAETEANGGPQGTDGSLETWLEALASSAPAPGGGAAGAVSASIGASLVEMVCALTIDKPKFAAHRDSLLAVMDQTKALRADALRLAAADATAFDGVIAAYKLPKATDADKAARKAAIQTALKQAAEVPLETARTAVAVIDLAESILDNTNSSVASDIAVAAYAARAALDSSMVNVEINLASVKDPDWCRQTVEALEGFKAAGAKADQVAGIVRERIAK
ncbi:MAG: cyclodeaminase/cyclohydrolase family protein [Rhodospirillaceae bacterium]